MDEKRTYDYKGTVTISTEEYRDLIEDCAELKAKFEDYRSKFWAEQNKVTSLQTELNLAKIELEDLTRWKNSKEELRLAFKLFLVEEKEAKDA
jgi:hypothetical protein